MRAYFVFIGPIKSFLGASFIFETSVSHNIINSPRLLGLTLHYCHKRHPFHPLDNPFELQGEGTSAKFVFLVFNYNVGFFFRWKSIAVHDSSWKKRLNQSSVAAVTSAHPVL